MVTLIAITLVALLSGAGLMWRAIRGFLLVLGALLTVLVYSLQFRKACEDSTPYQCLVSLVSWAGQGMVTERRETPQQPANRPPATVTKPAPESETSKSAETRPSQPSDVRVQSSDAPVSQKVSSAPTRPKIEKQQRKDGHDRRVSIINRGDIPVEMVYASGCRERNWTRDWLGQDIIEQRETYTFDFDDGSGTCCFDLRVVFRDGTQRTNMGVDVCKMANWIVSNR
jgi:hypothetical protein